MWTLDHHMIAINESRDNSRYQQTPACSIHISCTILTTVKLTMTIDIEDNDGLHYANTRVVAWFLPFRTT